MTGPDIDKDLIRELADLLAETGLTEIEVAIGDRRVRVARAGVIAPAAPLAVAVPADTRPAAPSAPAEDGPPIATLPGAVTSPMVGTLYVAPEPGTAPFVRPGDSVQQGQTLFIIEAMKTMNPIPAPRSGRVARVLVADGAPVEYGEVLAIIE